MARRQIPAASSFCRLPLARVLLRNNGRLRIRLNGDAQVLEE